MHCLAPIFSAYAREILPTCADALKLDTILSGLTALSLKHITEMADQKACSDQQYKKAQIQLLL